MQPRIERDSPPPQPRRQSSDRRTGRRTLAGELHRTNPRALVERSEFNDRKRRLHAGIHQRLTRPLGERGISVNRLSQMLGMNQSTLNKQFQAGTFSLEVVVLTAAALEIDLGWLVWGESGNPNR